MPDNRRTRIIFLLILGAVTIWLCYLIARPFVTPVFSAMIIAIVFYPVHVWLHRFVRRRNVAALLSTLLVLLTIIIPSVLLGIAIKRELTAAYQALSARTGEDGGWLPYLSQLADQVKAWLSRYIDLSGVDLRAELLNRLQQWTAALLGKTANVIGDFTSFLLNLIVAFFTLFFLFRDGRAVWRRVAAMMPLDPAQAEKLAGGVNRVVTASVYGGLAVAVSQGLLLSLVFWSLSLPSPVLWGLVTAMFSFVPFVGSGAVWLPAASILILNGQIVKGLILLGCGAAIIGMADNVVRPYIISEHAHFHPLLIFLALLGGVQAFGFIGLFAGPVVLAVAQSLFSLVREERHVLRAETSANENLEVELNPP